MRAARTARVALALLFIIASAGLSVSGVATAQAAGAIAARVNDRVIGMVELEQRLARRQSDISRVPAAQRPAAEKKLRREVLDAMIEESLIAQASATLGILVSEADIDRTIEAVRQKHGWTEEELKQELLRLGYPDRAAYREEIRHEMRKARCVSLQTAGRLLVGDDEIRAAYARQIKGVSVNTVMSFDEAKEAIRRALLDEKKSQAAKQWLGVLRQQARIELRL